MVQLRVLALDPSLTVWGWAARTPAPTSGVVDLEAEGRTGVDRLASGRAHLHALIRRCRPHLVLVEGYAYGAGYQAHQLGEMGGVLRLALHDLHVPWLEVAPKVRARLATGKGQAKKEVVYAEAFKRLYYNGSSMDEADACWILEAAVQHYQLPAAVQLPRSHMAALSGVSWPPITELWKPETATE